MKSRRSTPLRLRRAWIRAADNAARREPRPVEAAESPAAQPEAAEAPESKPAERGDPDLRNESREPPADWPVHSDLSGW